MPKRGWRRELQEELNIAAPQCNAAASSSPSHSCLATKLLLSWSSGDDSAVQCQQISHCAILDGAGHPELAVLAAAGSFGAHPGNIARDFQHSFLQDLKLPEAHGIRTQALDPKTSTIEMIMAACFLPHLMFHYMAEYDVFDQVFGTSRVDDFWKGAVAANDPKLDNHPMKGDPNWMKTFVPIFVHGDGVPFQGRDSLLAFVWGSLLSTMSSVDMSIYLAGFPKSCTVNRENGNEGTWWPVWMWIAWSFTAAFHGVHPLTDPWGNPHPAKSDLAKLAGKPIGKNNWKLCLWCLEGDHEYFSNVLGLPHWANAKPCWDCNTETAHPLLTWKHFPRIPGGWQILTSDEARAAIPDQPLFTIPGVATKTVAHDALHILFCKGVLSHLLGSVLHTMCWPSAGRQAMSPTSRLATIFRRVVTLYGENRATTRLSNLKLKMFTDPDKPWKEWPFLKIKGSEAKHLLPCLATISMEVSTGSEHDVRRTSCLQAMTGLVKCMDTAGQYPTAVEAGQASAFLDQFYEHYDWLQTWAGREERWCYHATIKFHMLNHLVFNLRYLNPTQYWCFKAEDNIGKLGIMCLSVSMGVRSTHLSTKLASKYRHFLHFRMTRQ